jgi:hypothetical protein
MEKTMRTTLDLEVDVLVAHRIAGVIVALLATAACTAAPKPDEPQQSGTAVAPTTTAQAAASGSATTSPTELPAASHPATPCAPGAVAVPAGVVPDGAALGWTDCTGLWVVASDGQPRRLSDEAGRSTPRFSPDRRQVAFQVGQHNSASPVHVVGLDGGAARVVIDPEALTREIPRSEDMPEGAWTEVWFYDWVPDGSALAFTTMEYYEYPGTAGAGWAWNYRDDLWVVPVAGGEPRQVLPPGKGGHFAFSPDGRRVALARDARELSPERAMVAVANADGSDHRVLFDHPPMSSGSDWLPYQLPRWMPDGQTLLVVLPPEYPDDVWAAFDGPARLLRLSLDGGTETVAEAGAGSLPWTNDYNAWWSPDGRRVAFLAPAAVSPTPTTEGYPPNPFTRPTPIPPALAIAGTDGLRLVHPAAGPPELNDFDWSPGGERFSYPYWDRSPIGNIRSGGMRLGSLDLAPRSPQDSGDWRTAAWLADDRLVVATDDALTLYRVTDDLEVTDPMPLMRGGMPSDVIVAPVQRTPPSR